jgi:hypothetical protein
MGHDRALFVEIFGIVCRVHSLGNYWFSVAFRLLATRLAKEFQESCRMVTFSAREIEPRSHIMTTRAHTLTCTREENRQTNEHVLSALPRIAILIGSTVANVCQLPN